VSEEEIRCHGDLSYLQIPEWKLEWTVKHHGKYESNYTHCSYCGSIHFEDVKRLAYHGAHFGGSDWKYGYPHKFYITTKEGEMVKFYTIHLEDLHDPELFAEIVTIFKQQTGIAFERREGGVWYEAPYHGYQKG
jgi:hypothetical protein